MIHGVADHGGRYEWLPRVLQGKGVHVLAFDHRGHGRSGGHRVHVDRWSRYLADTRELIAHLGAKEPDVPLFVYGHSMGSLIALALAIEQGKAAERNVGDDDSGADTGGAVAGWIVTGTSIEPAGLAKPLKVAMARLLSGVAPKLSLDLGIAPESISNDRAAVEAYRDDPLVQSRATVRWGAEALEAIDDVTAEMGAIRDPLLIMHGGADPLSLASGARRVAESAADATLHIYEGALHEPQHDPEFADVASDLVAWLDDHV